MTHLHRFTRTALVILSLAGAVPAGVAAMARFQATGFTPLGGDRFEAKGTLRLRGTDRPLTLPFTMTIRDGVAHAAGSVPLSRLAFGISQGDWAATDIVADAVTVAFDITARQRPMP